MNSTGDDRIALRRRALFAYGLFGLPLALVALPIYVFVPQFYVQRFGLSLAAIGAALLTARVLDAFIDPAFGWWIDHGKGGRNDGFFIALAVPALAVGFVALFHPPTIADAWPFTWFMGSLIVVYAGFSLATIAYQSWGAALTQVRSERARLTGTREACGLVGVLIAAALPSVAGIGWLSLVFLIALVASAALLLLRAPRPVRIAQHPASTAESKATPRVDSPTQINAVTDKSAQTISVFSVLVMPFQNCRFRWLFGVFVVNGIAAAIPATLFLFFAKDRLQLGQYAGLFLVLYFAAAACSLPLWVSLAKKRGEAAAWLMSMILAIAAFAWVYALPPGAATGFAAICVLSGVALSADLALPPALLAAVIAHAGHSGQREGAYFGAWSWATKMNLALAAGISLPLLQRLGYVPDAIDSDGVQALRVGYAVLPCALKSIAAWLLWRAPLKNF